ncbi:hypothetical protein B0H14DRAFT_2602015 [Mycena olivaceomarginata]|nr:hypothetical protein B0H14DRAFT_2602015 [Mycena olivaceomarginata]
MTWGNSSKVAYARKLRAVAGGTYGARPSSSRRAEWPRPLWHSSRMGRGPDRMTWSRIPGPLPTPESHDGWITAVTANKLRLGVRPSGPGPAASESTRCEPASPSEASAEEMLGALPRYLSRRYGLHPTAGKR